MRAEGKMTGHTLEEGFPCRFSRRRGGNGASPLATEEVFRIIVIFGVSVFTLSSAETETMESYS